MLQKLDAAKEIFSAILMITSPNVPDKEVHAFENKLRKIADIQTDEVAEEDLLDSTPFSCCTNARGVITSVWQPQK